MIFNPTGISLILPSNVFKQTKKKCLEVFVGVVVDRCEVASLKWVLAVLCLGQKSTWGNGGGKKKPAKVLKAQKAFRSLKEKWIGEEKNVSKWKDQEVC